MEEPELLMEERNAVFVYVCRVLLKSLQLSVCLERGITHGFVGMTMRFVV